MGSKTPWQEKWMNSGVYKGAKLGKNYVIHSQYYKETSLDMKIYYNIILLLKYK